MQSGREFPKFLKSAAFHPTLEHHWTCVKKGASSPRVDVPSSTIHGKVKDAPGTPSHTIRPCKPPPRKNYQRRAPSAAPSATKPDVMVRPSRRRSRRVTRPRRWRGQAGGRWARRHDLFAATCTRGPPPLSLGTTSQPPQATPPPLSAAPLPPRLVIPNLSDFVKVNIQIKNWGTSSWPIQHGSGQ